MQKFKTVDAFLESLDADKRIQVNRLRSIITQTEPGLIETIKWNAPNYVHHGEDRITFNVLNREGVVKLVLHMGATRKEDKKGTPMLDDVTGLVDWVSDSRGVVQFADLKDIETKRTKIVSLLSRWLAIKP